MATNRDNLCKGPCTVLIDGVGVGFTRGGVSYRKEEERVEVEADQSTSIEKIYKISERMYIEFTCLEMTKANIRRVWDEPATNLFGSQLNIGSNETTVVEHTMTIVGKGPKDGTRTVTVYRAVAVDFGDLVMGRREDVDEIPASFQLLKSNNAFASIVDT